MENFIFSLISVFIISLVAFVGIFWLFLKDEKLKKALSLLVAFSAGALLGDVFFHLVPELSKNTDFSFLTGLWVLGGIFLFLVLESFIYWRHCHVPTNKKHIHPVGITNLVGDGLHNFIDGMLIAGSFIVSVPLGITTSIAVLLHEIPQEIGDFGILIHAGFIKKKALLFNFLSALTALFGVLLVFWLGSFEGFVNGILAITVGGFIYIACVDLIPEMHKEHHQPKPSVLRLLAFLGGIFIMALLLLLE